ncbi:hypothetical protein PTKIN_Ptkin18bG0076100 [Pterospermum kingtungense]
MIFQMFPKYMFLIYVYSHYFFSDTFHLVRRKRDRNKESIGYQGSMDQRKHSENAGQGIKFHTNSERGSRRGGYTRNALPDAGVNREFRVVRDNRVNQNPNKDMKPAISQCSTSANEQVTVNAAQKGSTRIPGNQRPFSSRSSSQTSNAPSSSQLRHAWDANESGIDKKGISGEKQTFIPNAISRSQAMKTNSSQAMKTNSSQAQSAGQSSSSSLIGVYSSSTDPVHVPSPDSRSSSAVGAIKREVGVVGVRRQPSENAVKDSSRTSGSSFNSIAVRDASSESFRPFPKISRADQPRHTSSTESVMPGISGSRSFVSNQYGTRQHQQVSGHQKANQPSKEWKPKSSQKSSVNNNPGVTGIPKKSASPTADNAKDLDLETAKVQEKFSQVNIYENENVIIAQSIRVPENDRHRLTFGSFGVEFDSSRNFVLGLQATGVAEDANEESAASLSVSACDTSGDDAAGDRPIDILDDQNGNSRSDSPASGTASENELYDKKNTSTPQNLDSYANIGIVQDNNPSSYALTESHKQKEASELPIFSAYDPQSGYDLPYFRPPIDETVRGHGLPSPQEALSMHAANIPASTIPMVQQQPPVAQMYPQVHVSHFANLMPYRQFVSPIYLPQMAMPGYSSNPAYPHPSNGSSYLLMPGGSSHLNANGLKYGIQQFKPVPAGSPTGFGNFTSPSGYAINASGVVGNSTGLEDSSRIKYKDGNIYVPNQQADASDLWIQNPRELPALQSSPYYNMPQTPHGYMPSHTGHASYNAAAAAQSSHMQFSGLYHAPPQPAGMANPHHLGPAMGANVGVGVAPAAPGAQVGAYQQPQLGHVNWTTNF